MADKSAVDKARVDSTRADKATADKLASNMAISNKTASEKTVRDKVRAEQATVDWNEVANLTAQRIAAAGEPAEIYKRALVLRNNGDVSQAVALLRYAASTGHGPSSRLLAAIYRDGAPDVRANFRQAERYQALANAQGER